jgi:hypothetical protein
MTRHLIFLAAIVVIVACMARFDQLVAFMVGATLITLNLGLLAFAWKNILAKKLVALSVGVIVIKYAILGIIVFFVVNYEGWSVGWFAAGMGTLLISCVFHALSNEMLNNKEALS